MNEKSKKRLLALAIFFGGVALTALLVLLRAPAPKDDPPHLGPLVETITATPREHTVQIYGTGTVQPREEIHVVPQVSGRVVSISPRFAAGHFFSKGERLFSLESSDYRLAVDQARASLTKAQYDLALIEAQAEVARQEWFELNGPESTPNPLVVYEPQLANANATLGAAKATLKRAQLDLQRTQIRAPFNCFVRSEQIDLGQYVRTGTQVATLTGTDEAELKVPLKPEDIRWIIFPNDAEKQPGSHVSVFSSATGSSTRWSGEVVRSLGSINEQSRLQEIVVLIKDPYNRKKDKPHPTNLPVGMFVNVVISGSSLPNVFLVPRDAIHEKDTVWLVEQDNTLKIQDVRILRIEDDTALVDKGLVAGDKIITTNIPGASQGLLVRVLQENNS